MENQVTPTLTGYVSQQYPATVSFPATYRTLSAQQRIADLFKPPVWADWLRYFVARQTPDPPTSAMMTVYLSKEVADKVYFAAPSATAAATTTSNLFDHAGKGKGGGQFSAARGIAIGADGTISIVDQLNYRVQQFQPDGTFIRQWGGIGTGPDKFGQINGYAFGPTGIAVARGWHGLRRGHLEPPHRRLHERRQAAAPVGFLLQRAGESPPRSRSTRRISTGRAASPSGRTASFM